MEEKMEQAVVGKSQLCDDCHDVATDAWSPICDIDMREGIEN